MAKKKRKSGVNPRYAFLRSNKGMGGDPAKMWESVHESEKSQGASDGHYLRNTSKRRKPSGHPGISQCEFIPGGVLSFILICCVVWGGV